MTSSLAVSIALLVLAKMGTHLSTDAALVLTVAVTTVCWVATAYLGPETDRAVLVAFYRKVRPVGRGWEPIRLEAGLTEADIAATGDDIPRALLGWVSGCAAIWSALFTIGSVLYGRWPQAAFLFVVFLISASTLTAVVRRLFSASRAAVLAPAPQ